MLDYDDQAHVQLLDRPSRSAPTATPSRTSATPASPDATATTWARISGWTAAQVDGDLAKAFAQWERRSRRHWRLDLNHLRDYAINPEPLALN